MSAEIKTTHVLMVTDMSGSMGTLAEDVRGGFNQYVERLAADDTAYRLTVTLFDTEFIPLAIDSPVGIVPKLTEKNYMPRGMTALLDAVGKTIAEFDAWHGKVRKTERVLVVIQTDGQENSSREFTRDQIRDLIKTKEATGRWGFIYLGAGQDAWSGGASIGLAATSLATNQTREGTRSTYDSLAAASGLYSRGASIGETFAAVADAPGVADEENKKPA